MRFVHLGSASSEMEFWQVIDAARAEGGDRAIMAVEFVTSIDRIELGGVSRERKRWQSCDQDPDVLVYVGDDPSPGETTIWIAIAVGADGKMVTVLKAVVHYSGGKDEHQGLLADALDRKAKGRTI